MASEQETAAMRRAADLAAYAQGSTSPNPTVGAVVLDATGHPVGEGYTSPPGGPHAEIHALAMAGDNARGGTLVTTLEPCNHTGRTGPCAKAIIAAGIARVVVGVSDPNPEAAGGTITLRAAGVEVELGVEGEIAARSNEAWLTAVRLGRPMVTWKYAASLDGRAAAADGSSQWITGGEARADGHRLRAQSDAVMVGSGTILADDSHLTVRTGGKLAGNQPLRVVVDTHARTPLDAHVVDSSARTLIACGDDAEPDALDALRTVAEVVVLPRSPDGRVDLAVLLRELYRRDVRSLLLEGGPALAGAFVDERFIDRVVAYLAPALIGGEGTPALAGAGALSIEKAWRLQIDDVRRLGPDLRIEARPAGGH
ncbi:MAG: bifunctional diaminohydroxyphosphoribosylaminopyrimidine deaminase/5-amino-6-(5-phosphoribosylamino)uracil reductase RibD [Actinomycetota bacterium]